MKKLFILGIVFLIFLSSFVSAETLFVEQASQNNANWNGQVGGNRAEWGQSFKLITTYEEYDITNVSVLSWSGAVGGNIDSEVFNFSIYNSTTVSNDNRLATGVTTGSNFVNSAWTKVNMESLSAVKNNTQVYLFVENTISSDGNYWQWAFQASDTYANGARYTSSNDGNWALPYANSDDMTFRVYADEYRLPLPIISDICSTSPDPDDCTEPYNIGNDLTPSFNFTTDLTATCYIGDDNSTWTVCSTTGSAGEHICTEPATHPLVWGVDKVYLNCSGDNGNTYDELDVVSTYLSGNVTDNSDRLISGALVTASKNNTATVYGSNITDTNGYWIIGADIGFYTICAYDPDNITLRGDCTPFVEVD